VSYGYLLSYKTLGLAIIMVLTSSLNPIMYFIMKKVKQRRLRIKAKRENKVIPCEPHDQSLNTLSKNNAVEMTHD